MSFRSKQTSLTNLSSGTERLQPFDGMYFPKSELDYISRPKNNTKSYFTKSFALIFMLSIVCTLSYLITSLHQLQRTENENKKLVNNAVSLSSENKLRLAHLNSRKDDTQVNGDNLSIRIEIEKLKQLVDKQKQNFSNAKQEIEDYEKKILELSNRHDSLEKQVDKLSYGSEKYNQIPMLRKTTIKETLLLTTSRYPVSDAREKQSISTKSHDISNLTSNLERLVERMDKFDLKLQGLERIMDEDFVSNVSSKIDTNSKLNPVSYESVTSTNLEKNLSKMNEMVERIQYSITIPRSCHVYQQNGATKSGTYLIDPDGPGATDPFNAFCDFEVGVTVIEHDMLSPVPIPSCEGKECFSKSPNYQVNKSQLLALTSISESCFQEITFNCFSAPLIEFATWIDKKSKNHSIHECSCNTDGNCHPSAIANRCNCDSTPPVQDSLEDKIKIEDRSLLPITGFRYDFLRGEANVTIGKLFCKGMNIPTNIYQLDQRIMRLENFEEKRKQKSWKLAANINPCDGGKFGYGGPWSKGENVGNFTAAFRKDYLNDTIWREPLGYITIARHNNGTCVMSKTWKLKDNHRSLYSYFSTYPGRIYATGDGSVTDTHTSSDLPESPENIEGWLGSWQDPIFGANGGLVFNWCYGNNGVRIAVTGGHVVRPYVLPGVSENTDDLHGLGNEFGAATVKGEESTKWWHDVGKIGPDCSGRSCQIVGTDHGTLLSDGSCWGSYAIYVSTSSDEFECGRKQLNQFMTI